MRSRSTRRARQDPTAPRRLPRSRPARDAGVSIELIRALGRHVPTLGVCLGHQAIVEAFGGEVGQAKALLHGKASTISHDGLGVFAGLPDATRRAGRYHSLAALSVPAELKVTARTADGEVMGVRHASLPIEGVQFHPESRADAARAAMARNFLRDDRRPCDRSSSPDGHSPRAQTREHDGLDHGR